MRCSLRYTDDLEKVISFTLTSFLQSHQFDFTIHESTLNIDKPFEAKLRRALCIARYHLHRIIKASVTYELSKQGSQVFLKFYLRTVALLLEADFALLDLRRFNEDDDTVPAKEPTESRV